ncbi:MAG: EamA family transporter [Actinomycetota bacterium]
MNGLERIPRTRGWGLALAFVAACISGVAVFVNSEYVGKVRDATVYTTAKNMVAASVLLALLAAGRRRRSAPRHREARPGFAAWAGLLTLGVVGGSVSFVLFFEGLARADSPLRAGFIHKTLVVWVALLAVPLLRERITALHAGAIGLLIAGQIALVDGLGSLRLHEGEAMVLAATLLWSVEFVVAKRLLADVGSSAAAAARLGIGVAILIGYVTVSSRFDDLAGMSAQEWKWVLVTGAILAGFVATWFAGLARAQAIDVTAVLVFGQIVTSALTSIVKGDPIGPNLNGLVLIGIGVVAVVMGSLRTRGTVTASP